MSVVHTAPVVNDDIVAKTPFLLLEMDSDRYYSGRFMKALGLPHDFLEVNHLPSTIWHERTAAILKAYNSPALPAQYKLVPYEHLGLFGTTDDTTVHDFVARPDSAGAGDADDTESVLSRTSSNATFNLAFVQAVDAADEEIRFAKERLQLEQQGIISHHSSSSSSSSSSAAVDEDEIKEITAALVQEEQEQERDVDDDDDDDEEEEERQRWKRARHRHDEDTQEMDE
jgi:hypothetical protein